MLTVLMCSQAWARKGNTGKKPAVSALLVTELSPLGVTKRRQEAQKSKRQKGKAKRGMGGGSVAQGLVPHFLRTNGVSLSINYRRGEAPELLSDEELLMQHWERVQQFDQEKWEQGLEVEKQDSSSRSGKGQEEVQATPHSRVWVDDKGCMYVNWPWGEQQLRLPVVGGGDPGGANLLLTAVRQTQKEDLQQHNTPLGSLKKRPAGRVLGIGRKETNPLFQELLKS